MRDVDQLAAIDLLAAKVGPLGECRGWDFRMLAELGSDGIEDPAQELRFTVGITGGQCVHDPIRGAGGQKVRMRPAQVGEQVAAAPAIAGRVAMANAFVHAAMVDTHEEGVVGVFGIEDGFAVEVDCEPGEAAVSEEDLSGPQGAVWSLGISKVSLARRRAITACGITTLRCIVHQSRLLRLRFPPLPARAGPHAYRVRVDRGAGVLVHTLHL